MKQIRIIAAAFIMLSVLHNNVSAQPNVFSATAGNPFVITTDGGCNSLNTNLQSVNADMIEFYSSSGNTTPMCVWSAGTDDYIWGVGYSGVNNACTTGYSGITVGISSISGQVNVQVPCSVGTNAGAIVNNVDVAVGVYDYMHSGTAVPEYFALVTYETGGEIYVEHFNIVIDWSVPSFTVDIYTSGVFPFNLTNNAMQVSSAGATASYPHISLIYDDNYPAAGAVHSVVGYVVTWQQGTFGNEEVWGIDAPISTIGQYTPFTTNTAFKIDDGMFPDVAGVTAANITPGSNPSLAYVTYLTRNADEVHLAYWDYNTTTVNTLGAISATVGAGQYQYPRIAGPQHYDYNSPVANDPACAVTVNDLSAPVTVVNTYTYFTTGGPTVVDVLDASDYAGNGFSAPGYTAMKPVITGAGTIASSLYTGGAAAYTEYPTVFYTDYTNLTSPFSYTNSGDIYAMGTEMIQTASPAVTLESGSNYWEVNGDELPFSSPIALADNYQLATSTTHNSGFNLITAYDGGNAIYAVLNIGNTPYAFKPGRTTGITAVNKNGYKTYPNPVYNNLHITGADGATFFITDVLGRTVSTGAIQGNKTQVSTANFTPGIYIITLAEDNHTEKVKFVKQ